MSVRILLAPTLDLARPYAPVYPCRGCDTLCMGCAPAGATADLTIEAEYGSTVIEGSRYTAAHHQPKGSPYAGDHVVEGGRPSPCVDERIPYMADGIILLSHIDLDSVGGVLRAIPMDYTRRDIIFGERTKTFWALAARVDVMGPHHADELGDLWGHAGRWALRMLRAYWAWSKARPRFPRDVVSNVTDEVMEAGRVLAVILDDSPAGRRSEERIEILDAGDRLANDERHLNAASFVRIEEGVLVRESDQFVNHMYTTPDSQLRLYPVPRATGRAVAAINTKSGAITVSLASPVEGVSCRAIVQSLWGPDAGGHDGIAGSPRGKVMASADLDAAVRAIRDALRPPATCGHCGGDSTVCDRATSPGADCVAMVRE